MEKFSSSTQVEVEKLVKELTERQFDVLTCLMFDVTSKAIGKTLNIQYRTVQGHFQAICKKMKVSNKNDLIKLIKINGSEDLQKSLKEHFEELTKNDHNKRNKNSAKLIRILLVIGLIVCIAMMSISNDIEIFKVNSNVYLLRREMFIKKLIKNQHNKLDIKILYGYGGSGKTTIVREYLRRSSCKVKYEINASSFDSLSSDMIGLAYALSRTKEQQESLSFICNLKHPVEKLRQVAIFIYSNLKNVKSWCLLFDNINDFRLFNQICINTLSSGEELNNGQILITTRNHSSNTYMKGADLIRVDGLIDIEKEKLFKMISGKRITSDIRVVLDKLPAYPLDIACFSYYLKTFRINGYDYWKQVKSGKEHFWNNNRKLISSNSDYSFTRYDIVNDNLESIIDINPKFKNILFVMSCMSSKNIPVVVLEDVCGSSVICELALHLVKFGMAKFIEGEITFCNGLSAYIFRYFEDNMPYEDKKILIEKLHAYLSDYSNILQKGVSLEELKPHLNKVLEKVRYFNL